MRIHMCLSSRWRKVASMLHDFSFGICNLLHTEKWNYLALFLSRRCGPPDDLCYAATSLPKRESYIASKETIPPQFWARILPICSADGPALRLSFNAELHLLMAIEVNQN